MKVLLIVGLQHVFDVQRLTGEVVSSWIDLLLRVAKEDLLLSGESTLGMLVVLSSPGLPGTIDVLDHFCSPQPVLGSWMVELEAVLNQHIHSGESCGVDTALTW